MRSYFHKLLAVVLFSTVFACGVSLEPIATPDVTLDPQDKSLSAKKGDLGMKVQVAPQGYQFYGMENTFLIFFVQVDNFSSKEMTLTAEDFAVIDDKRNQSLVMRPEEIAKLVEQNLFYLIPYPYIGYYSESENYYEGRYLYNPTAPHVFPVSPRDIYIEALPLGKILPNANVKGKVYFKKRLTEAKSLDFYGIKKDDGYIFNFKFGSK